jgi:heat shock protein HspQ
METKKLQGLMEAYASIYTNLLESHYNVGDKVTCKESGMTGKVVEVDPEEKGKYYTVDREDGKKVKYSPEELEHKKENQKEEVEYFTEEVEIASQYFCNLGLNEDGVAIVIEELGTDEFSKWVYEIAEEYVLNEANETRLQQRGSLKGPKGSRPQSTTKKRIKKQGGTKMSADSRPESTIRLGKRDAAVEKAKIEQPRKRPVLDAIARRVNKGMERHNAAMKSARETGETISKAAKGAATVAKGFASGVSGATRLAGRLLRGEEVEVILSYLLDEGYANNEEAAETIAENMSEEWMFTILEGHPVDDERLLNQMGRPYRQRGYLKSKPRKRSIGL